MDRNAPGLGTFLSGTPIFPARALTGTGPVALTRADTPAEIDTGVLILKKRGSYQSAGLLFSASTMSRIPASRSAVSTTSTGEWM